MLLFLIQHRMHRGHMLQLAFFACTSTVSHFAVYLFGVFEFVNALLFLDYSLLIQGKSLCLLFISRILSTVLLGLFFPYIHRSIVEIFLELRSLFLILELLHLFGNPYTLPTHIWVSARIIILFKKNLKSRTQVFYFLID